LAGERRSAIRDVTTLDISVAAWFDARGFGLGLSQEGAVWWARLTPKANPESVIDRYGKGDTPVAAAQRARERYEHEQESHAPVFRNDARAGRRGAAIGSA
jgi:hypothetical protein